MTGVDSSWEFLKDFYQSDQSIASLVNKAIGIRTNIVLRDDCFENLMDDLLSLLPTQVSRKSYQDFLNYVKPEDETITIDNQENAFLRNDWFQNFIDETFGVFKTIHAATILTTRRLLSLKRKSKHSQLLVFSESFKSIIADTKKIIRFPETLDSVDDDHKPYLILQAFGLAEDWYLYGRNSDGFIDDEIINAYFRFLRQQRFKLRKKRRRNIISRDFKSELSVKQLYPVMTLLIVLRREWEYSKTLKYLGSKYISLNMSAEIKKDALIYGLYRTFDYKDDLIIKDIDSKVEVPRIEFHPLVTRHIIKHGSYSTLFEYNKDDNSSEITDQKEELYKAAEEKLDNESFEGTRLLLDYMFPFTKVREHDVFLPRLNTKDRIYLSFNKGSDYHRFWRPPEEGEKFDRIQIEPEWSTSKNDYDYIRVTAYRDHLAEDGVFFVVQSSLNYKIQEKIHDAFSHFRHSMKGLMSETSILILQKSLSIIDEANKKINRLKDEVGSLINHPEDNDVLTSLKSCLLELESDSSLKKIFNPKMNEVTNIICDLRKAIYQYNENRSLKSIASLPDTISRLNQRWANICIENLTEQKERIDNIKESHEILCNYIDMAGRDVSEPISNYSKEPFKIVDFLKNYQHFIGLNTGRIVVTIDDSSIEQGYTIYYNKIILHIILDTIVDNAIVHGFSQNYCELPTIEFALVDQNEYLLLKICNNGRPIAISNEDYKTSGVFAGPTGHTGLGGYQINRYAELLGGYVNLPEDKKWNTEIHLYIRKNNCNG